MSKTDFIKLYCFGCGAELQNDDPHKIGYIPKYLEKDSHYLCQRCFRLQNYGINKEAITFNNDYSKILASAIKEKALIIYVVDLFAFESSIVPALNEKIKNANVVIIASKRDVIPSSVKDQKLINFIKSRFLEDQIEPLDVMISSSKKNYNVKEIMEKCNKLRKGKSVYLFGAVSVGKSSLANTFLKVFKNKTTQVISTSPYPGTTLDVIKVPIDEDSYIFDTPGISLNTSIYEHIDQKLLKYVTPNKDIKPRVYQLMNNQSLLVENIAKIDLMNQEKSNITIYLSNDLNILRTKRENSERTFVNMIKNRQIKLIDRNIHSLDDLVLHTVTLPNGYCDVVISGLLWIKIKGKGEKIQIYCPKGVEVSIREVKI